MSIFVKICGISDEGNLKASVAAGTDYIGLVHYPKSPRHVSLEKAASLCALLPSNVASVVVVVDPTNTLLADILRIVSPDYIQLHGHETLERIKEIRTTFPTQKFIKAIAISCSDDIAAAQAYSPHVNMLMFDAKPPKNAALPGGNGLSFDWQLLAHRTFEKPWMLSGGLNALNVGESIRITAAKIVDVSSGVETSPGVKDAELIKQFIDAAKA